MGIMTTESITHDSQTRTWEQDVPAGSNLPLVINLHGGTGTGSILKSSFNFTTALTNKAVMVYPSALTNGSYTAWNVGGFNNSVDDLGFIQAMIDVIVAAESIDVNKIYVIGHSLGAVFSQRYASESIRVPYTYEVQKVISLNGAVKFSEDYSYTNELYVLKSANDDIIELSGNSTYLSYVYENSKYINNVNNLSEMRILYGNGHTVLDIQEAFIRRNTTLEQYVIDCFNL